MPSPAPASRPLAPPGRPLQAIARGWWNTTHLGAQLLVLALSPSSYHRRYRQAMARFIYLDTAPNLLGFSLLAALISLVLTRIVVVTASSYGLSAFAVQMVVRVLVLELIPTTAALFVALRCTIPRGAEVAAMRNRLHGSPGPSHGAGERHDGPAVPVAANRPAGQDDVGPAAGRLRRADVDALLGEILPRVIGGIVAVWTLVAVSCALALIVGYLVVYGFAAGGLDAYTRTVGQVFSPDLSLIFFLKTLFLSLAVAVIPMAWAWAGPRTSRSPMVRELRVLVRLFIVILLLEILSLLGNYYG